MGMDVFREFFDYLKDVLTDDSVRLSVASLLFSRMLITAEVRDACTVAKTGSTSSEKALHLLTSIETRLCNDFSSMEIFIEVLRKKLIWQNLVDRIEQAYETAKKKRNTSMIPHDVDGAAILPASKRFCVEKDEPNGVLDVECLSDESMLKLHALKTHFASMTRKVVEILQTLNHINLSSMKIYIKEMLKPNFELNMAVTDACTLSELFTQLSSSNLWDYWNYQLLADIITEFGNNDTERLLAEYDKAFIQFNKDMGLKPTILTINRNKSLEPVTPGKPLTKVELQLSASWYTQSLIAAKSLVSSVLSKAKRLFFSGGRINCVILEFCVMWSEEGCDNVLLTDDDCLLLQQEDVLSLSVNERLIFSKLEGSNFEMVNLNLKDEQSQDDPEIGNEIHPQTVTKLHQFVSDKVKAAIFQLEVSNLFTLSVQLDEIRISEISNTSSMQSNFSLFERTVDVLVLLIVTLLPLMKNLRLLSLSNLPFGSRKGGVLLMKGLAEKKKLSTLQLVNTKLYAEEANVLINTALPNLHELSTLNLSHNNLSETIMIDLIKCLPNTLKMLYLSSNEFSPEVTYNLSSFLQNSTLSDLFLTDCGITDTFIEILCTGLRRNRYLKTLSIGSNPISDAGAGILIRLIIHDSAIQILNLWNTPLTSDGIHTITTTIASGERSSLVCITLPLQLKSSASEIHNISRINWV